MSGQQIFIHLVVRHVVKLGNAKKEKKRKKKISFNMKFVSGMLLVQLYSHLL